MPRALKLAKELAARGLFSIENPQVYLDLAELDYAFTEVHEAVTAAFAEIEEGDSRPSKERNNPPAHQFIWDSTFFWTPDAFQVCPGRITPELSDLGAACSRLRRLTSHEMPYLPRNWC
jgi:hypothetical protein